MKRRAAWIAGIVGVAAVALIALFLTADINSDPLAVDTNQLVGKPAPSIDSTDTKDRPFRLDDYRGRWVLLNFFATWCGPCITEHPELIAFDQAHRSAGDASVVSVAFNDEPEEISDFFATNGGDWAVVADDESDISIAYAVIALPESYLIDPEGVVVHKFSGGITRGEVERVMADQGAEGSGGGS